MDAGEGSSKEKTWAAEKLGSRIRQPAARYPRRAPRPHSQARPAARHARAAGSVAGAPAVDAAAPAVDVGGRVHARGVLCGDEGCWPSMYLVGAQKASTTALFQLLRTSSGICGATARPGSFPAASYKEVH